MTDTGWSPISATREDPECQNGIDDDGDGRIDFDGGRAANGGTQLASPDPQCKTAAQQSESGACGLGFEGGLAALLVAWRRRKIR